MINGAKSNADKNQQCKIGEMDIRPQNNIIDHFSVFKLAPLIVS